MKDGGPAFPQSADSWNHSSSGGPPVPSGMSLRDYFAAKAMASLLKPDIAAEPLRKFSERLGLSIEQGFSRISYRVADAMLAERDSETPSLPGGQGG